MEGLHPHTKNHCDGSQGWGFVVRTSTETGPQTHNPPQYVVHADRDGLRRQLAQRQQEKAELERQLHALRRRHADVEAVFRTRTKALRGFWRNCTLRRDGLGKGGDSEDENSGRSRPASVWVRSRSRRRHCVEAGRRIRGGSCWGSNPCGETDMRSQKKSLGGEEHGSVRGVERRRRIHRIETHVGFTRTGCCLLSLPL